MVADTQLSGVGWGGAVRLLAAEYVACTGLLQTAGTSCGQGATTTLRSP